MSITRRSFLKIFATFPVVASGLPALSLAENNQDILDGAVGQYSGASYYDKGTLVGHIVENSKLVRFY